MFLPAPLPTAPLVLLCSLLSSGRGGPLRSVNPALLLLLMLLSCPLNRLWMDCVSNHAPGDWEIILLSWGGVRLPHRAGWMSFSLSMTLHLHTGQGSVRVPQYSSCSTAWLKTSSSSQYWHGTRRWLHSELCKHNSVWTSLTLPQRRSTWSKSTWDSRRHSLRLWSTNYRENFNS